MSDIFGVRIPTANNITPPRFTKTLYQCWVKLRDDRPPEPFAIPTDLDSATSQAGRCLGNGWPAEVRRVVISIRTKVGKMPVVAPTECIERRRKGRERVLEHWPNPRSNIRKMYLKQHAEEEENFPQAVDRLGELRTRRKTKRKTKAV